MKTLFQPIHSLSHLHVELGNKQSVEGQDLLRRRLHAEVNSFTVSVPVPGMSKGDLNVYTDGRVLVVSRKGQPTLGEHPGTLKRRDLYASLYSLWVSIQSYPAKVPPRPSYHYP